MSKINRKTDESPSDFFLNIKVSENWKYLGKNDIDKSIGAVYRLENGAIMRVFFDLLTMRGGICKKEVGRETKYECLISNKISSALNEWISDNDLIDKL